MFSPNVEQPFISYIFFVTLLALRYIVLAIGTYIIVWVLFKKWTSQFKISPNSLPRGQLSRELIYSLQTCFIFAFAGLANFYINKKGWGLYYQNVADYGRIYWWFTIALMLVLNDVHFYWVHRLLHWGPLYKNFHSIHHMSRSTTPLTSQSFHAVESVLNLSIVFIFPFLFPLHITAYIAFALIAFVNNVYGHSGYEFWPRPWVKKAPVNWLNTSTVHSWHHEKVNGNFGLYFTFCDRIFGTYKDPTI